MRVVLFGLALCGLMAGSVFGQSYKPGQLHVRFKPGCVTLSQDSTGFTRCEVTYIDSINLANHSLAFFKAACDACDLLQNNYLVIFPESANIPALAGAYLADTSVVWAGPNYSGQLSFTPNDFYFRRLANSLTDYQWPLDSEFIQMEKAWDITRGDSNVVVALMEAALAWRHPDLRPSMWINTGEDTNGDGKFDTLANADINNSDNDGDGYVDNVSGYSFYVRSAAFDCFPNPEPGPLITDPDVAVLIHGAWVWSNVGAETHNRGAEVPFGGVAGVGFDCRVMPVAHALDEVSFDNALCFFIRMRNQHNVPNVVNMSLNFPNHSAYADTLLDSLSKLGVVLVAAAGNTGNEGGAWPAIHPRVISVAATDTMDYRADFSTYGTTVDLSSPGFNYMATHDFNVSTKKPFNYRYDSRDVNGNLLYGTSFSAPQVAGVAALIRSAYPSFIVNEVWAKLKSSTDSLQYHSQAERDSLANKMGTGRLNAFKALTFFGNIPNATNDTTLSGTVYVSGDITVRAGKTLRLAAGTLLRFYPGDVLKSGSDVAKTAIVVDSGGIFEINGTPGNPVRFVSFRREDSAAASYDSGQTFTPNVQINDSTTPMGSGIDIVADNEHVYVVWSPYSSLIRCSRSDDSGRTFPFRSVVNDLSPDSSFSGGVRPSMAIGGGLVGVIWLDLRYDRLSIRFSASSDQGQTFPPGVVVDSGSDWLELPSLFWKNGLFYAVWQGDHPRPTDSILVKDIYFSYSPNGGASFVPYKDVITVDTNLAYHSGGSISVNDRGKVFVVWADDRYSTWFQPNWHLFVAVGNVTSIKGDLNLDGMLSPVDVVLELNAVFLGQSYSAPFESGDGNCDGQLSPADVILLLYAVFLSNQLQCEFAPRTLVYLV